MVGAINKLYGKTWELNGATYVDGVFTFPANGFAMATCSMPNPIPNHIYYGSVEQKAPSGASFDDRRFEWWKGDGAGELMVFAYMDGTNDQWVRQSAVYQAEADTSGTWIMRNFTVNGTAEAYRRNPIIIDLTETFGAGNEPSAAWVDANMIPSANGDTIFFDVPSALSEISDKRRMMLAGEQKGFYVFKEGVGLQNGSKYLAQTTSSLTLSSAYIAYKAKYGGSSNPAIAVIFGDSRLALQEGTDYLLEGTTCGTGIDFTKYKKLYIDAKMTYKTGVVGFRGNFGPYEYVRNTALYSTGIKWVQSQTVTTTRQVFEFDISSISGKRYIQASTGYGNASNQYIYIYGIWLE